MIDGLTRWWRRYILGQAVTDEKRRMDEKLRHIEEQTRAPEDTWELVSESARKDARTDERVTNAQERIRVARAEYAKRIDMLAGGKER